jgi:hypothetical protein
MTAPLRFPRLRRCLAAWVAAWSAEADAGLLSGLETTITASLCPTYAFVVDQECQGKQQFLLLPAMLEAWPPYELLDYLMDRLGEQRYQLLCDCGRGEALKAFARTYVNARTL